MMTIDDISKLPPTIMLKIDQQVGIVKTCLTKRVNSIKMGALTLEYEIDIDSLKKITFTGVSSLSPGISRKIVVETKEAFLMDDAA